jgi:hypothetical protein
MEDKDKSSVVVLTYGFRTLVLTEQEAKELSQDRDLLRELVD